LHALLLSAVAILAAECPQGPGRLSRNNLAPTMDRLVAAYEDLASKRFQVIADFEDPAQATLFRLEPAGAPGDVGVTTDNAQLRTGVGSLKVRLGRAGQRLVCASHAESQWGLPRDWSKYNLLLISVYSPRQLGGFVVEAHSGTSLAMSYQSPPLLLRSGWNLLRLDLGDMADYIDLSDVRSLEFRCDPLDSPVDIHLDDLIVVDNTRELFATPEKQPGDLYVRSVGRRLSVGAQDRFELTFSHGRIRQWFDLGTDKTRIHNLVGPGALGPLFSPASEEGRPAAEVEAAAEWLGAGTLLQTYQSLIGANPLRVVIRGEWRFTPPNQVPSEADPYHRWWYSIYRDGRVYVECSGTALGRSAAGRIAISFCCDASTGLQTRLVSPSGPDKTEAAMHDHFLLFSRPTRGQADLLVAPFKTPLSSVSGGTPDARTCGTWVMSTEEQRFVFATMIRIWPPDLDSPELAAPMVADYRHPLPLQIDVGQLVRTDPGDFDNDGFSEGRGYYVLQLDGAIAKIRIDGHRKLRFSPLFKLVDVAHRDVWIYADGRQIRDAVHDEDGNLIFAVPGVISRETLLEITSRPIDAK
jgi:hypothetical protein